MKRRLILIMLTSFWFAFTLVPMPQRPYGTQPAAMEKIPALNPGGQFGTLPLYFVPNRGQANEVAKFYARTPGYTLWMTGEGLVFDSINEKERDVWRLIFPGANPGPEIAALELTQHRVNYIKGNDPNQWHTGIPTSKAIIYKNIYNNIDLKVYGIERQIEYDWIIKPGGKPESIRCQYQNAPDVRTRIDEEGNLVIATRLGEFIHKRPISYQEENNLRTGVEVKFKKMAENTFGFEVGKYNKNQALIIDPVVLVYSTFLGGSDKDHNFGLTIDGSGSAYLIGDTYSLDFPTHNAYRNTFSGGGMDIFVTKFSPEGDSLVYSTYLGGSRNDVGECIKVDSSGKAYVTGITYSFNFPTYKAYQATYAGGMDDAFVTVLNASGSGLLYSTYLGGNGQDEGFGISLDSNNNMYIAGRTASTNFPILSAFKTTRSGNLDAFITKFSSAGSLIYSTYLGGSGEETAYGIAVKGVNAYVAGRTNSTNFPTLNEHQDDYGGGECDAFVTKFSASGNSLIYSTYLGGSFFDTAYGIEVDGSGRAYVTGDTFGSGFPIKNAYQSSHSGEKDAFLTRFSSTGNTLEYSTFLGGVEADTASHVTVDSAGKAYITGSTRSSNFPTKRALQNSFNGNLDVFIAMFSANGSSLNFSTYLGGGNYESGRGIAVDSSGNIYVTGYTESTDFPVEAAYQNILKGSMDAFLCKISLPDLGSLCGSVDNCNLTWTTGGAAGWTEQTEIAYYDDDAAQSGVISNSQTSDIQAAVTGPGMLNFYWSVSSESYYDGLAFYIDGTLQNKITGSIAWEQQTYVLPEGTHTLKWSYEKDGNLSLGSDCGWLDKVEYTTLPEIMLSRKKLTFGSFSAGTTGAQTFTISNKTDSTLNWSLTADQTWINYTPISGVNSDVVIVSVNPSGLAAGTYTGTLSVTDSYASNSPQVVTITLNVYQAGNSTVPFGEFATPTDQSIVSSSVPFTGWVLDDIGVPSVKLYRQEGDVSIYIGDALFVEGARPDVETSYPNYPYNYIAGWGYMMLTNFLPDGGNGTFTITAKAMDLEGNEVILGSKTITVDNVHAVKPFGAIDRPVPGGTVSGSAYKNEGWVLTPLPNTVPKDGSTIDAYIDGVKVSQAAYNFYRSDIASLFPGYNNSNGAHAYFYLDSTKQTDGIHTIVWVATDNAGNADGIGSRYFTIRNTNSSGAIIPGNTGPGIENWTADPGPVKIIKGYGNHGVNNSPQVIYPDEKGIIPVEIKELERIEIKFTPNSHLSGWMVVGDQLRALPVGSRLDAGEGLFYWQPGPGFVGEYHLLFIETVSGGNMAGKNIWVHITPKF